MDPTTSGRFRVHNRRPRPDMGGTAVRGASDPENRPDEPAADHTPEEFILVPLPADAIDPDDPDAADQFDPIYVTAAGYDATGSSALADRVQTLKPGYVVDATLAWSDGSARFRDVTVVRETRFRFADEVTGMFEAAVDAWQQIRADGEAVGSITTRSNDGDPNGALYLFADAPGGDAFDDLRDGRLPIEPLIGRVNATLDETNAADGDPREVFVLQPAAHSFVAVYVVFDRDGVLAQTVRDTYGLGPGLAAGLDSTNQPAGSENTGDSAETGSSADTGDSDEFDALDRL